MVIVPAAPALGVIAPTPASAVARLTEVSELYPPNPGAVASEGATRRNVRGEDLNGPFRFTCLGLSSPRPCFRWFRLLPTTGEKKATMKERIITVALAVVLGGTAGFLSSTLHPEPPGGSRAPKTSRASPARPVGSGQRAQEVWLPTWPTSATALITTGAGTWSSASSSRSCRTGSGRAAQARSCRSRTTPTPGWATDRLIAKVRVSSATGPQLSYAVRAEGTMNKKQRHATRKMLANLKLASGCIRCEYNKNPDGLQFDHRDPTTKVFNVSQFSNRTVAEVLAEVAKCDVRCGTCHAIRSASQHRARNSLVAPVAR